MTIVTESSTLSHSDPCESRSEKTRERILDGAVEAISRHGLGKLTLGDVSACAAVSRATVYRYFSGVGELLTCVAQREGRRFQEEVAQALREAPGGSERIHVALQEAVHRAREHPILSRIAETDPAFLLSSLRREFPTIKQMFDAAFGPLLHETALSREGVVAVDEMVDWLTRIMISAYLFPDPDPERMARQLSAVYRVLTASPGELGGREHAKPALRTTRRGSASRRA